MMQGLYHGITSTRAWIYYMYINKHTRQKSLKKYMKSWISRLARLNDMFDTYIKESYKVVDYQIKTPSMREHDLTWRPYVYYKRRKAMAACRRCIALKSTQIIEARSAVDKERRLRMEFDTDSFDILIDNCCSHTLTNDINDYIEPPVKSTVRVRGYNGSTNSTMVGTVKWIMIRVRYTVSCYQTHIIHLQWKPDCYHHNTRHRPERKEEFHTVLPTMMQS
jgi:hypothetical protein